MELVGRVYTFPPFLFLSPLSLLAVLAVRVLGNFIFVPRLP
jgi:hypothetical protein